MATNVSAGRPQPLGATWDARLQGTHFALYSEHATRVELCLFDDPRGAEVERITLPKRTQHVSHGLVAGIGPGQLYGYRVYGPYAPRLGQRFNPAKLLIDPYAKAIAGPVDWSQPVFGYRFGRRSEDLTRDVRDSARGIPKGVVIDNAFDWGDDRRPNVPFSDSIIYEVHVKGLTMTHPEVPRELRGTYAGLASPAMIEYFQSLGVTAIELLPTHHFVDDQFLRDRGLTNYWGYNSIGYFAPESRYSSSGCLGEQVAEFKAMVKALHAAGLEVILDVVYNHTAEGNHLGPTLCFRGVDNLNYYNLVQGQPRYYMDFTGTGNTLNVHHAQALKLIADSLRYWVQEMHVDGFRFDLALTLGREPHGYDKGAGFFDIIHQDPVLSQVKLIAEPWDVGDYGYQVGNFPILWSEWNGRYRDNLRRFWKGDESQLPQFASHITGSSDMYAPGGRGPTASVNFVTAHDGFTLHDLVSYNDKHNEANGENNQDGHDGNESWNTGVEGPTDDPAINRLRLRRQRNFLASLFLSQGVPMLLGGDEIGRTQRGNNNAYCQDNELSWYDWKLTTDQSELLEFTKRLIRLRKEQYTLRQTEFLSGQFIPEADIKDLTWIKLDGTEMTPADWNDPQARSLGMRLAGRQPEGMPPSEDPAAGTLLVLFNAYHEELPFVLPEAGTESTQWALMLDTRCGDVSGRQGGPETYDVGDEYPLGGRSVALLRRVPPADTTAHPPPRGAHLTRPRGRAGAPRPPESRR